MLTADMFSYSSCARVPTPSARVGTRAEQIILEEREERVEGRERRERREERVEGRERRERRERGERRE